MQKGNKPTMHKNTKIKVWRHEREQKKIQKNNVQGKQEK